MSTKNFDRAWIENVKYLKERAILRYARLNFGQSKCWEDITLETYRFEYHTYTHFDSHFDWFRIEKLSEVEKRRSNHLKWQ